MKPYPHLIIGLACSLLLTACASGGVSAGKPAGQPVSKAQTNTRHAQPIIGHPDATPFIASANAKADVATALSQARVNRKFGLVVMGANWCKDSRALAGHLQTLRFKEMIGENYELVYVDLGRSDKNLDVPRSFGIDAVKGTPIVIVTAPSGKALNLDDASRWSNAASRTSDDIYAYFAKYTGQS